MEPSEEEVSEHAELIANTLVRSWVQTLLEKRRSGIELTALMLLPIDAGDNKGWREFWESLETLGLERTPAYELACGFCEKVVKVKELVHQPDLRLPHGLVIQVRELRKALVLTEPLRMQGWFKEQLVALRDSSSQPEILIDVKLPEIDHSASMKAMLEEYIGKETPKAGMFGKKPETRVFSGKRGLRGLKGLRFKKLKPDDDENKNQL